MLQVMQSDVPRGGWSPEPAGAWTGTAATNRAPLPHPEQLEQKMLQQVTSVLCSTSRAAEETVAAPLCPQLSSR